MSTIRDFLLGACVAAVVPLVGFEVGLYTDVELLKQETNRGMSILEEMIPRLDKSMALLEQSVKLNTEALEKLQ